MRGSATLAAQGQHWVPHGSADHPVALGIPSSWASHGSTEHPVVLGPGMLLGSCRAPCSAMGAAGWCHRLGRCVSGLSGHWGDRGWAGRREVTGGQMVGLLYRGEKDGVTLETGRRKRFGGNDRGMHLLVPILSCQRETAVCMEARQ